MTRAERFVVPARVLALCTPPAGPRGVVDAACRQSLQSTAYLRVSLFVGNRVGGWPNGVVIFNNAPNSAIRARIWEQARGRLRE